MKCGHEKSVTVFYYAAILLLIASIAWGTTSTALTLLHRSRQQRVQSDASNLLLSAVTWCIENKPDLLESPEGAIFEPGLADSEQDFASCLIIVTEQEADQSTLFIRVESARGSILKTAKTSLVLSREQPALAREEGQIKRRSDAPPSADRVVTK